MILLHVASKSETKIEEIAQMLIESKLVIDVNIHRKVERAEFVNNNLVFGSICLLTAKTRAVLFDIIDKRLNEMYPDFMPETYAIPIMQMDWRQADNLVKDVQSIKSKNRIQRVINKVRGKRR